MASYALRATLPGLTQGVTFFFGHAGAAPKWMLTLCQNHVSAKPWPISNFGSLKQQIWTHRFPFRNCHKSGSNRKRFGQNPGWFNLLTSSYASCKNRPKSGMAEKLDNGKWRKYDLQCTPGWNRVDLDLDLHGLQHVPYKNQNSQNFEISKLGRGGILFAACF